MKISVGPAPSHWGREKLESFYRALAQCPVDYVYLGETTCPLRTCFSPDLLNRLYDKLVQAGKKVYISSLTLVRTEKQYRAFMDMARRIQHIEINSPAFLGLARKYHAVTGVFLNVYNSVTANILAEHKVERIMLPCELDFKSTASIARRCTAATELIAHGHIPVGISGICQTVRSLGHSEDDCGKLCQRYPEGMILNAGNRPMFRIDGPRTLSASTYCLVEYLPQLAQAGIDTIRILPQCNHTDRIVCIYRDVLDNRRNCIDAAEELKAISPGGLCNGWFLGKAGWVYEAPNMSHTNEDVSSCPVVPLAKQTETDKGAFENYRCDWSDDDILHELSQLLDVMNNDPQFIENTARLKDTTVVFSATDTERSFIIKLNKQGVQVHPYTDGPFDVRIQADEQVFWEIFSGRMDADAAFFAGKASVSGSIVTAFRIKNKFLSFLQKYMTHRLEEDKSFANHY